MSTVVDDNFSHAIDATTTMAYWCKFCQLLRHNPHKLYELMAYAVILFGLYTFYMLQKYRGAYGRYSPKHEKLRHYQNCAWMMGPSISARFAWFVQECPSFFVPAVLLVLPFTTQQVNCYPWPTFPVGFNPQTFLLALFFAHYFQRSFIFPYLIRGGKPTPVMIIFVAGLFCAYNGLMQYLALTLSAHENSTWLRPHFLLGCMLYFTGVYINLQADAELRSLRRNRNDTSYRIPQRGMYQYVTAANYFGEWIEWCGFALACWNLAAVAFAVFTACNVGPRAVQHHAWYKEKFRESYPSNRKAFIPFVI